LSYLILYISYISYIGHIPMCQSAVAAGHKRVRLCEELESLASWDFLNVLRTFVFVLSNPVAQDLRGTVCLQACAFRWCCGQCTKYTVGCSLHAQYSAMVVPLPSIILCNPRQLFPCCLALMFKGPVPTVGASTDCPEKNLVCTAPRTGAYYRAYCLSRLLCQVD